MCAFHERGIVCALYCLHRRGIVTWLCGRRAMWAWSLRAQNDVSMVPASAGFVQNFVYVLHYVLAVLCITIQCSASTQLCCLYPASAEICAFREHGIVCLPQTWNACSVLSLQQPWMYSACSSQTAAFITLHLPYQNLQIYWNNFVNSWNGTSLLHALLHHATFDLTIQTNASGSWGYGALSHPHWFEYA